MQFQKALVDIETLNATLQAALPKSVASWGAEAGGTVYVHGVEDTPENRKLASQIVAEHNPLVEVSRRALLAGDVAAQTPPQFRTVLDKIDREVNRQWQRQIRPNGAPT